MNSPTKPLSHSPRAARRQLLQMVIGAAIGGGAALILFVRLRRLDWADALALISALVCLISAVVLFVASFDRKTLSRKLKVESEATPAEVGGARLQAGVLALSAVIILGPVLAEVFGNPAPGATYAALLGLLAIQFAYNRALWRRGDEFVRHLTVQAGAATFWLLLAGLCLYGMAERLDLAPPATAWDLFTAAISSYLLVSCAVGLRRLRD